MENQAKVCPELPLLDPFYFSMYLHRGMETITYALDGKSRNSSNTSFNSFNYREPL